MYLLYIVIYKNKYNLMISRYFQKIMSKFCVLTYSHYSIYDMIKWSSELAHRFAQCTPFAAQVTIPIPMTMTMSATARTLIWLRFPNERESPSPSRHNCKSANDDAKLAALLELNVRTNCFVWSLQAVQLSRLLLFLLLLLVRARDSP